MRALIYARTSIGADKDCLDNQIARCREFAKELDTTETIEYIDEGFQSSQVCPAFIKMLQDYCKGDIILTLSVDRLTRKIDEFLELRGKYNIKILNGDISDDHLFNGSLGTYFAKIAEEMKKSQDSE